MEEKVKRDSLRSRLKTAFLTLSVGPLLFFGLAVAWQSYRVQTEESLHEQQVISIRASDIIREYFHDLEERLLLATRLSDVMSLDRGQQKKVLSAISSMRNGYNSHAFGMLCLLDRSGRTLARVFQNRIADDQDLGEMATEDAFRLPMTGGGVYYGPVVFNPSTGEPTMMTGIPLLDVHTGLAHGVLVGEIRIKDIWGLVAGLHVGDRGYAYLVNGIGKVIAHKDFSLVLRGVSFSSPGNGGIRRGLTNAEALIYSEEIRLGGQRLFFVTERPLAEALAPTLRIVAVVGLFLMITLSGAVILGMFVRRRLLDPIESLSATALAISEGDLKRRAEYASKDEIGTLVNCCNAMATQLTGSIDSLSAENVERRRAEAMLLEAASMAADAKARAEAIIASIGDMLSIQDTKFKILYQNQPSKDLLGEHVGEFCYKVYERRDRVCEGCPLQLAFLDGKTHTAERAVLINEEAVYVEVTASPVKNEAGEIVAGIEMGRDVTENIRQQEALRESEARKSAMVDAFDGLLYVCSKDYRIEFMNQRIIERTGHDAVGEICYKVMHGRDSVCPWCVNEQVFRGETVRWELQSPRDGRWYYVVNSPVFHPDGTVSKQSMGIDVTARKQAEEALQHSHDRLVTVLDGLHSLVYVADIKTHEVLFINKYARESFGDVTGKICWQALQKGQTGPCEFCSNDKLLNAEGESTDAYAWEFQNTLTKRWYYIHDKAIRWVDGRMVRLEIATDITDRKEAEEKTKASLLEKEMLLREIHHRVKNNMQVVSSLLDMQACQVTDARISAMFKSSRDRIKTMALIHEKLYGSGNLAKIDFGEYIKDLMEHVQNVYGVDPGTMAMDISVESVEMDINTAVPLALIIHELISNAIIHAFPQGGDREIRIALVSDETQKCTLTVTDNGVGFPEGVDPGNPDSLGMQLVSSLVRQLKGEIRINSSSSGTEIRISFLSIRQGKRRKADV